MSRMHSARPAASPATPPTPPAHAASVAADAPRPYPAHVSERAIRLYREAIVVDMHNDLPSKVLDEGYDPDIPHTPTDGHTDIPRLVASGITAQFFAAWVDARYALAEPGASFARALRGIEAIHALVQRHPERLRFATTTAHVRQAKADGKVAVLIGVEGGHAIEDSLDKLRELHRRGARYLTLTWNNGNAWAGSSLGSHGTRTGGLTPFGAEVIREMNRLGMLVDVSHASDETVRDVIAVSTAPVIASHSSARALSDHPRNLDDELLRAIARTGGVVNVNFYARFIDTRFREVMMALEDRLETEVRAEHAKELDESAVRAAVERRIRPLLATLPLPPLAVLIDHIGHIASVAGIDHVGLGSDFDGVSALPIGLEDVTGFPRIAEALLDRGYSEPDVRKVLGGNMLRVMAAVLDGVGDEAPAPERA
jgi:membrane dipeptidase